MQATMKLGYIRFLHSYFCCSFSIVHINGNHQRFFLKYQKHPVVEAVFKGLRPAVVGLLAAAALVLMNAENFGSYQIDLYQFIISIIIFLVTFIGTRKYKINPILMIILCGVAGFLLY